MTNALKITQTGADMFYHAMFEKPNRFMPSEVFDYLPMHRICFPIPLSQ